MDFRMEKSSWLMIVAMIATMAYFVMQGAGSTLNFMGYLQVAGIAILTTVLLIAIACIPVLIYCYFVNKIPDIDYSIIVAFAATIVGVISELIF